MKSLLPLASMLDPHDAFAAEIVKTALPSLAGIVATVLSVGIVGMCFVIAATPFATVFR